MDTNGQNLVKELQKKLAAAEKRIKELENTHSILEALQNSAAGNTAGFLKLLDRLPWPACVQTPDHAITYSNDAFNVMFSPPEGRPCYAVLNGRSAPCAECKTFQTLSDTHLTCWERISDSSIWKVHAIPFLDADMSPSVLVIIEDATQRRLEQAALKRSEAILNETGRIAKIGGWEFDIRANNILYTKELLAIFDLDQDAQLDPLAQLRHCIPADRPILNNALAEAIVSNKSFDIEVRCVNGQQKPFWARIIGHPVIEQGACVKIIGALQDISTQKKNERELILVKNEAESANQSKSEFLANISHEIRTPLNGVIGMLHLLEKSSLQAAQQEQVQVALQASECLSDLLGDILDLSRLETGRMSINAAPFPLSEVVEELRQSFHATSMAKGIRVETFIHDKLPRYLIGDRSRLGQILFNLVGNAIKFTRSGTVEIQAFPLNTDNALTCPVIFAISDTGVGISENMLVKVFDAFTQEDGSFSRQFEGAGLGLPIVKRLVGLIGGEISIASKLGAGTTVYFSLPFEKVPEDRTADGANANILAETTVSFRVLIVEDDQTNQLAIRRIMEQSGCVVACARNGHEALEFLKRMDFDLILMDIVMPKLDGLVTTRLIRNSDDLKAKPDIPIIALTAYAMSIDKKRALDAGMNAYLAKPVDTESLFETIQEVMTSR